MTRFLSLLAVILFITSPAMAQEDADKVLAEQAEVTETAEVAAKPDPADYEERLKLSQKMHEIWPIRPKIEGSLDAIAARIPEKDRLKLKTKLRQSISFDALETASIDSMVDIFTKAELEKMIEFYGSKEGRSVSFKTKDYEAALQPILTKMFDKALLDAKMGSQSVPK